MIKKTKDTIRKLEFGVLEFLMGALIIIGLIGYFWHVPADLDWLDHTISFILFTILFYHLGITSILFGHKNKKIEIVILVSYFFLFFKDIVAYTKVVAFKFVILKFVNYFYLFFNNTLTVFLTFYIGALGLIIAGIYITRGIANVKIKSGFLFALKQKPFKSTAAKFLAVFLLLLWFYYFVYNLILEWLEFTLDDPIIVMGILFFITRIVKHKAKFHKDDFVFKIGEFSESLYKRFIALFHHKKTIPIAISGLMILHSLSDLGVFSFSLALGKENIYLEQLSNEHLSFYELYTSDLRDFANLGILKFSLAINYILNALSFIALLIIPVVAWFKIFYQKELHINRIFLPIIFSSITAFIFLPAYSIQQIKEIGIVGVDVASKSLLETSSLFSALINNKLAQINLVAVLSIAVGIIAYAISSNARAKKELYAISILIGLFFYTGYIYHFSISLVKYFYLNISLLAFTPHFLVAIILLIIMLLSIAFYIGGYLVFIYEIIMEYHKRKWSEPIDEELVKAIKKLRSVEKKAERLVSKGN